jgi:hypothetical protein
MKSLNTTQIATIQGGFCDPKFDHAAQALGVGCLNACTLAQIASGGHYPFICPL